MEPKQIRSNAKRIAHGSSQLYLRLIGEELANLYVTSNHANPSKLAATRAALRTLSPAIIGIVIGETIEAGIRDELKASWRCLQCGMKKDQDGKCPVCSI